MKIITRAYKPQVKVEKPREEEKVERKPRTKRVKPTKEILQEIEEEIKKEE